MSNLHITTTQGVKLFFTPASIGERMLAYIVDTLIKIAYVIIAIILYGQLYNINQVISSPDEVSIALICLFSLPVMFYTLLSETFMDGQTPGKKMLKIKVVKIDGFQAGFFDFLIRWIFAIIDIQFSFVPGLISMISTKHTQRLGDLAAGTAVITEKSKYNISHTILMDVDEKYEPYFAQNQVIQFTDNDIRIIKENTEMALRQKDVSILIRLTQKIESVMNIRNPFDTHRQLIDVLLKDYNFYTGK
jgi:uncharacterized RDD family membrane protein YckC